MRRITGSTHLLKVLVVRGLLRRWSLCGVLSWKLHWTMEGDISCCLLFDGSYSTGPVLPNVLPSQ